MYSKTYPRYNAYAIKHGGGGGSENNCELKRAKETPEVAITGRRRPQRVNTETTPGHVAARAP